MSTNGSPGGPAIAAIDAGTNSVHVLVATVGSGTVRPITSEKAFLGLGSCLERGELGEAGDRLVDTIAGFVDVATEAGATRVAILGTEPFRRATDASDIAARVERAAGIPLEIVSHEEEGLLTLLGVTEGVPIDDEIVVADIGGGSTEIVLAGPARPAVAVGLRLGSGRLIERLADHDPPTDVEMAAMRDAAVIALADAPDGAPGRMVVVGGTATNLLHVVADGDADPYLDQERLAQAVRRLVAAPSAVIADRFGVHPVRARTLTAGAAILSALLDRYGLDRLTVSEASIREGALLAMASSGGGWRAALPGLVGGGSPTRT